MHIKPGARNSEKITPLISITLLLKPQQKICINNIVVIAGATSVG